MSLREVYVFRGIECSIPEPKEVLERSVRHWQDNHPGEKPCPIFHYSSTRFDRCGIQVNVNQATVIITPLRQGG